MSLNKTQSGSSADDFSGLLESLQDAQSVGLTRVLVAALFIFVLRAKTTYVPISVPALLLASYQEWSLYKLHDISTVKYSLYSILGCWFGTFAYRLAKRRMMMHKLVHPCSLSLFMNHKLIEQSLGFHTI